MPSVVCLPPKTVRRCLEQLGYRLIENDEYNWAFAQGEDDVPLIIPHTVPFMPMARLCL